MSAVHFFTNAKDMNKWKPEKNTHTHIHPKRTQACASKTEKTSSYILRALSSRCFVFRQFRLWPQHQWSQCWYAYLKFSALSMHRSVFRARMELNENWWNEVEKKTHLKSQEMEGQKAYTSIAVERRERRRDICSAPPPPTAAAITTTPTTTNDLNDLCTFRFFFP